MKKILALSIFAFCLLLIAPTKIALADSYGSYGNGGDTPTDLTINKEVKNPLTNEFVENLGSVDPKFSPGVDVTFRLTIKNGSGETFNPVEVVDQLPEYVTYVSSSIPATYDAGLRRLVFKLENMIAGETRTIEVTAKVADRSRFSNNRSLFCLTNYTKATAVARPNGDDDTAEFCLITAVNGAKTLPVAGFNDMLTILPFLSLGGIGAIMLFVQKQKA